MTGPHVTPIEFVLFDLGGVLMEVDGVRHMQNLSGLPTEEAVWERWLTCDWVRQFERGRCRVEEFSAGVVSDWSLSQPRRLRGRFQPVGHGHLPGRCRSGGRGSFSHPRRLP